MSPKQKQQSTMWATKDKPNPTKVVCAKSTSKQMVACFFDKSGHVATEQKSIFRLFDYWKKDVIQQMLEVFYENLSIQVVFQNL